MNGENEKRAEAVLTVTELLDKYHVIPKDMSLDDLAYVRGEVNRRLSLNETRLPTWATAQILQSASYTTQDAVKRALSDFIPDLSVSNALYAAEEERDLYKAEVERLREALASWPCAHCGGKGNYLAKGRNTDTGAWRSDDGEIVTCKFCEGTCIDPRARSALHPTEQESGKTEGAGQ